MIVRLAPLLLTVMCVSSFCHAESVIQFDLPATAQAIDVTPAELTGKERVVSIQFNLSLIADALPAPQAEQLVVQVSPLGGEAMVADYAPRTELSSGVAGNIEVSQSQEHADHVGVSLDAAYNHFTHGKVGADRGEKNIQATKYHRVAPLHVVAASGTTHRGRGVYFKLRADDSQVLEGDKQFKVVLRVPSHWRGELIEFRVEAESMAKSFSSSLTSLAGIAPKSQVVGVSRFIVATHLVGDDELTNLARQLGEAELQLRNTAINYLRRNKHATSRTSHVSFRFDLNADDPRMLQDRIAKTIERVIFGKVDPYIDSTIRELSIEARVAILDYLDARREYLQASCSIAAAR